MFLSELFQGAMASAPEKGVTHLPMKQARLDLPNPTMYKLEKWMVSCVVTGYLVAALQAWTEFHAR